MKNGLDITIRSQEGYSLRDNLLVQVRFHLMGRAILNSVGMMLYGMVQ